MDARRWRRAAVSLVVISGIGLLMLFGAKTLGFGGATAAHDWLAAARGPWAPLAAVGVFAVMAFLGVPQFVLIAAAVGAFGPWLGLAYSWIATMASSLVGFWLGRAFGARLLQVSSSQAVERFTRLIGRNGFWASLVVRLVPFAPFIVVNVAAGATPMGLADFTAGTAIGIVPKIALTALAGDAMVKALSGGGAIPVVLFIAAAAVWLIAGLMAGQWLKRRGPDGA